MRRCADRCCTPTHIHTHTHTHTHSYPYSHRPRSAPEANGPAHATLRPTSIATRRDTS